MNKLAEIDRSTNSNQSSATNWRYPETRQAALEAKDLGAKISLEKGMAANLVNYFQEIGADNQIPSGKKEMVSWLNRFHLKVAVNNPLWPEDLPFGYVYAAFINAIMYDRVELRGHNIKAHIQAFKNWITQSGIEHKLYRDYYDTHPEAKKKELAGPNEESEETIELRAKGFVNFPPPVVREQIETIERIQNKWGIVKAFEGSESYYQRLLNTREKMKEEGNW